jgi:hypothetical protein
MQRFAILAVHDGGRQSAMRVVVVVQGNTDCPNASLAAVAGVLKLVVTEQAQANSQGDGNNRNGDFQARNGLGEACHDLLSGMSTGKGRLIINPVEWRSNKERHSVPFHRMTARPLLLAVASDLFQLVLIKPSFEHEYRKKSFAT